MQFKHMIHSSNGLIGYSGFVGSNILKQSNDYFNHIYNSKNIEEIQNKEFNVLVCAGLSGNRRWANEHPDSDFNSIRRLVNNLNTVVTDKLILISTIDVYTAFNLNFTRNTYAGYRKEFENYCVDNFDCMIIRLPLIFGEGLKKNAIFDLIHKRYKYINKDDVYQCYDLKNIWLDILKINWDSPELDLFSVPIPIKDIAKDIFNVELTNTIGQKREYRYRPTDNIFYSKDDIYDSLREFIS